MKLELNIKALSVIAAGLRELEKTWTQRKESSSDEDEISELTNDILYVQTLRASIEKGMTDKRTT